MGEAVRNELDQLISASGTVNECKLECSQCRGLATKPEERASDSWGGAIDLKEAWARGEGGPDRSEGGLAGRVWEEGSTGAYARDGALRWPERGLLELAMGKAVFRKTVAALRVF